MLTDSTSESILDGLKAVYFGGERVAIIVKFSMDNTCSNSRCGLKVKQRADSAKIADVYETRAGMMDDVFGEAKVLVEN